MKEKLKIFVIEDNRTEAMIMKLAFSGLKNIETRYFQNGKELLTELSELPDIVICDLMLPDIHGLDLIKTVRKEVPDTSIIVVSAQESIEMISKIQDQGVFNYIVKCETGLKYVKKVLEDLITLIHCKN